MDDLLSEIRKCVAAKERVLVTTLTKRMSEDLTEYLDEHGVKVRYLHSDVDTVERVEILRDLRLGVFDVLVGINLLREGLDLPEVALVAILDADKEGFLRSERSLIQTIGRAARHINGRAILYADKITGSMERALAETDRRRAKQVEYNEKHGITPKGIAKNVHDIMEGAHAPLPVRLANTSPNTVQIQRLSPAALGRKIKALEKEMLEYAKNLEFEKAIAARDEIEALKQQEFHS